MDLVEDEACKRGRSTLEVEEGLVVCYGLDPVVWLELGTVDQQLLCMDTSSQKGSGAATEHP